MKNWEVLYTRINVIFDEYGQASTRYEHCLSTIHGETKEDAHNNFCIAHNFLSNLFGYKFVVEQIYEK